MTWMITRTGARFDLGYVAPLSISTLDIAHSLANTNRFNGHALRPYSVAEHSLLVVDIMERHMGLRAPRLLLAGLLHDAHEAYTGDLSTPMKDLLDSRTGGAWRREEQRIEHAVLQRFGVLTAAETCRAQIKHADLMALATEKRDLMPPHPAEWPCLQGIAPADWLNLRDRDAFTWQDWAQAFLDRFAALTYAIDLRREG